MVPITSDLTGYAAFWQHWVLVALSAGAIGWAVIVVLLVLILRKR